MEYIPFIAVGISGITIIISAFGLWNSRRAQRSSEDAHHQTQIVAFEQRKQELRLIFLEQRVLYAEVNSELNQIPDSAWLREKISQFAVVRHQTETSLENFDKIPASPSTEARLRLERIGAAVNETHDSLQTLLKALRDHSAVLRGNRSTPK